MGRVRIDVHILPCHRYIPGVSTFQLVKSFVRVYADTRIIQVRVSVLVNSAELLISMVQMLESLKCVFLNGRKHLQHNPFCLGVLTHLPQDKMAAISQTILSNAFL